MKTPIELAEEFAKINGRFDRLDGTCLYLRNAFLVGYKTAQQEYEARIKELEQAIIKSVDAMAGVQYDDENT